MITAIGVSGRNRLHALVRIDIARDGEFDAPGVQLRVDGVFGNAVLFFRTIGVVLERHHLAVEARRRGFVARNGDAFAFQIDVRRRHNSSGVLIEADANPAQVLVVRLDEIVVSAIHLVRQRLLRQHRRAHLKLAHALQVINDAAFSHRRIPRGQAGFEILAPLQQPAALVEPHFLLGLHPVERLL